MLTTGLFLHAMRQTETPSGNLKLCGTAWRLLTLRLATANLKRNIFIPDISMNIEEGYVLNMQNSI